MSLEQLGGHVAVSLVFGMVLLIIAFFGMVWVAARLDAFRTGGWKKLIEEVYVTLAIPTVPSAWIAAAYFSNTILENFHATERMVISSVVVAVVMAASYYAAVYGLPYLWNKLIPERPKLRHRYP